MSLRQGTPGKDPAGVTAVPRRWQDDYDPLEGVPAAVLRREKERARRLRRSRWWQQKVAAGVCHYCGRRVGAAHLTMDHVVPLARGGKSTRANCVPCCKACNSRKKAELVFEWDGYMGQPRDG